MFAFGLRQECSKKCLLLAGMADFTTRPWRKNGLVRCALYWRKRGTAWKIFPVDNFFSTPFHVVTRCAQNWTFWTDRPLCLQLTYIYFWTIWNLRPNFPELSKIYNTFCGQFWKIGVSADYIFQNCPQNVLYILDNSGKFGLRFQIVQKYIYVSWRQSGLSVQKVQFCAHRVTTWNGVENFYRPEKFSTKVQFCAHRVTTSPERPRTRPPRRGENERRGKFFRSIKIFHKSPVLCASGDHVAGEAANAGR